MNNFSNIKSIVIVSVLRKQKQESISLVKLLHSSFVRNDVVKRTFLIFLFLGVVFSSFSQTSNKKKVLVIPYGRFEFVSDFTLEEIAEKNEIETSMVFNAYQKAILNQLAIYEDENFTFLPITAKGYQSYKQYVKYVDAKFKGKNHYGVDIQQFPKNEFTALMEEHDASFVLFINWYQIKKETFTSRGKKRTRYIYASHYMDYEVYNLFQQKLIGVGKQRMEPKNPTEKEAAFSLLRLSDLYSRYQHFIPSLIEVLNNPFSAD
ncbi:MAG: hypothetical protein J5I47_13220 [Vicingus serpentipes]|nr:hypothetical protein [Vicingus serpentipes]